jgi:hypothetical protein
MKEWEYPDDKFIVKFYRDTSGIYIIKDKKQKPIFQNFGYKRFDDYIVITSISIANAKQNYQVRNGVARVWGKRDVGDLLIFG